jgi:MFS transporter, UMF1 family
MLGFFFDMNKLTTNNKTKLWAWAMYDWANSAYSLVITSSIFPLYFGFLYTKQNPNMAILGTTIKATAVISYITAIAFLTIAILSPILSGIADFYGNKKRFMQFFCTLGTLACFGLYFFTLDNNTLGLWCYYFGLIGYWGSLVFYNSYLADICVKEEQDTWSARGFSLGYIGSVLLLIICLANILSKEGAEALNVMRFSFALTGFWWIFFSLYTFYHLPKSAKKNATANKNIFTNGIHELQKVKTLFWTIPLLKAFLMAFFVYSMAVQTVMLVATYFGEQEILWKNDKQKTQGLIISILVIQLVAVVGALITAKLAKKYSNFKILISINVIWICICIYAFFVYQPLAFYITAGVVGLVMGGVQSLSRSTFSKLLPKSEDTTSFFSFYDVTEKIGIVVGMFIYATIDHITGSTRIAIIFLGLFFFISVFFLLKVLKLEKTQ